ncbi:MAG: hypothetical protein Q8O42_11855 [Acidobacteriota bacterium]|nr:hypothetical protein [Acidobacteriota bacterium]
MPTEFSRRMAMSIGNGVGNNRHDGELRVLKVLLCVLCGAFLISGCADRDRDLTIRFLRSETYTFTRAELLALAIQQ